MGAWHFLVLSAGKKKKPMLENPHANKFPPFRGGVLGFFRRGGGGSGNFIVMGVGIFPKERISSIPSQMPDGSTLEDPNLLKLGRLDSLNSIFPKR